MKTTSTFAIIDIKQGREALCKLVEGTYKVPVVIEGYIIDTWSGDDGVSMEFQVDVTKHKIGKPIDCGGGSKSFPKHKD